MKKTLQAICLAVMMMAIGNVFGQVNEENGWTPVNKYGYQDASGKMVIPLQFYDARPFSEGMAAVRTDDSWPYKWGYINEKGNIVIEPQYYDAGGFSSGLAAVEVNEKYGYIDKTGKMVIQPQFDDAYPFTGDIASVRIGGWLDGKWGCIDKTGKIVIQPIYEYALDFSSGPVAYVETDGKILLVNNKSKTVVEIPAYLDVWVGYFEDGWATISVSDKYGLVDENGWVMEPQFDYASIFGSMAWVAKDDRQGFLKKNGQWLVEPKEYLRRYYEEYENIVCVFDEDKYGYINGNGWLVQPQYTYAEPFSEGLAVVSLDDSYDKKLGFIDTTGKMCIEPQFYATQYSTRFIDGWALVGDENYKSGFIDKKGKWAIQPQYDDAHIFYEDLAAVAIDGKWGYIDKTGKTVINLKYDNASDFSEGLAAVQVDGKWGYIDTKGKMVIQPNYDYASEFGYSGQAWVCMGDGVCGHVDRNGNFTPDEE